MRRFLCGSRRNKGNKAISSSQVINYELVRPVVVTRGFTALREGIHPPPPVEGE
jgi:hypothetical protein